MKQSHKQVAEELVMRGWSSPLFRGSYGTTGVIHPQQVKLAPAGGAAVVQFANPAQIREFLVTSSNSSAAFAGIDRLLFTNFDLLVVVRLPRRAVP